MQNRRRFIRQLGTTIMTAAGTPLAVWGITAGEILKFRSPGGSSRRIFIARFAHETNTFHPVATSAWRFSGVGSAGIRTWEGAGLEIVPGISATPSGGGLIEEKPCREAMDTILSSLRDNMPVDAVFLRLHGAMYAEGIGHAETVLVEEIRQMIGTGVPIACTYDLHGNIPPQLGLYGDILVGLKTAPHTDAVETAEHAGRLLLDVLEGKIRPVSYILPIPFIVQGEKAMTTAEPFGSLVAEARRIELSGIPGFSSQILAATLFVGCAWTDAPHTGMSVMITADGSKEAARAAAIYLARKIWDARHDFDYGCETAELEEGVSKALSAKESTVFLTDSGDNVTASTPGDLPLVLRHLIERKVSSAVVACINDAAAVKRCVEAGEGKKIRLSIGATIDKRYGPPLETDAEVLRIVQPGMVLIKTGSVEVVLTDGPATFRDPSQFEACGINPLERKIVVTKMGYLYPGLTQIAPRHIMLLTPGAGDMRIEKLPYSRLRRPIYPLERDTLFEPEKTAS